MSHVYPLCYICLLKAAVSTQAIIDLFLISTAYGGVIVIKTYNLMIYNEKHGSTQFVTHDNVRNTVVK